MDYQELEIIHKKERKELKAKVADLKNSIPVKDRKKRKEILVEIKQLEDEMSERHEQEMNELLTKVKNLSPRIEEHLENGEVKPKLRNSKARRRREKKANLEKEREERIAKSKDSTSVREEEQKKFEDILNQRNLEIHEILADGNCMFRSIQHQLSLQGKKRSFSNLRRDTANYMIEHKDDFMPFVSSGDDELITTEDFQKYCNDIANTNAWGGHVELQALSDMLQVRVEILQADGPSIIIGESNTKTLLISYHRHILGVGEHYNSVVTKNENVEFKEAIETSENVD